MSVIPSQPYAKPPKLIVKTAMEIAAEHYDMVARSGLVPITVSQKDFARKAWPQYLAIARSTLQDMLSGGYPESLKQEIYEAFIEEREAAELAAQRFAGKAKGLLH